MRKAAAKSAIFFEIFFFQFEMKEFVANFAKVHTSAGFEE